MHKRRMGKRLEDELAEKILSRLNRSDHARCTVDEIVYHLQTHHREVFGRQRKQALARSAQRALQLLRSSSSKPTKNTHSLPVSAFNIDGNDDDELHASTPSSSSSPRKKPRIASASDDDDENEDGSVSTSEDAIYGQKLEPKFDLMKSMLRQGYNQNQSSSKTKPKLEEKNMEMEVATNKPRNTIEMGGTPNKRAAELKKEANAASSSAAMEVKGKDGPRFRDLGGMEKVLEDLKIEVIVPLYHPHLPQWLGVRPMSGILLHGPPGCGKTKLAHAIANETGVPFYQISAPEVVSGVSGASEENIRELFSKAYRTAPSIVFIDEIDAIASKRENLRREMERRIVTQLMTCMASKSVGCVLVIGATNRPDALDPAVRRRFDREIVLGVPDENARHQILSLLTRNLTLEGSFDLLKIARATPGFVGCIG